LKNKAKKKQPVKQDQQKPDINKPLDKQQRRQQNIELLKKLLPLVKAFILWFLLVLLVHIPGIKEGFRNLTVGLTTESTYYMGKILQIPIDRLGFASLTIGGFAMEIIVECTAYNFYLFVIALAIFANWSWKHKIINLLIFFVIIFIANNLRFFAMGYVGGYYPKFFSTTHDYVWNILFGFMIFGIWAWRDQKCNPDFRPKKKPEGERKEDKS
jgi:exosortase/archaeosortase family protein